MRKINLAVISIAVAAFIFVPLISFSQESFTLTTYFPAPYGTYRSLRLFPRTDFSATDPCYNKGELRFQATNGSAYACDGNAWLPLGGGLWRNATPSSGCFCLVPLRTSWNVGIGTDQAECKLDVRGDSMLFQTESYGYFYAGQKYHPAFRPRPEVNLRLKSGTDTDAWNFKSLAGNAHLLVQHGGTTIAEFDNDANLAIGKALEPDPNPYFIDVNGKFRANNFLAQTTAVTCGTGVSKCSTTINFPSGRFIYAPTVVCSAGPWLRNPSGSSPYLPLMCSVSNVTATRATITIGVNRTDMRFDGEPKFVDIIALEKGP